MPRIAASLGVFGLVVLALGLNIAQFPIEYCATVPRAHPDEPKCARSFSELSTTREPASFPVAALRPTAEELETTSPWKEPPNFTPSQAPEVGSTSEEASTGNATISDPRSPPS